MYPFKGKGLFRIVWILVTVLVVCLAGCAPHTRDDSNLQIHVLSAGQADAVLIRHETGDFLIDSGDSDGTDRLLSLLQKFHVRRLEALILTHPHEDHIGGTPVLLETLPVACIYDNGQESESPVYAHYRKIAAQKSIPCKPLQRGYQLTWSDGLVLSVLSPPARGESGYWTLQASKSRENNFSLICRLEYGTFSMLFMGDAERESERILLQHIPSPQVRSAVLKNGHHGSRTATTEELVKEAAPAAAVISCGAGNSFGFPHREVLSLLASYHIPVYRTDRDGTISISSDGTSYTVEPSHDDRTL